MKENQINAAKRDLEIVESVISSFSLALKEVRNLHSERSEQNEDFTTDFFSLDLDDDDANIRTLFKHVRQQSISLATRVSANNRWRFNITLKMQKATIHCIHSISLIREYESFLFQTSPCGSLHWIHERVMSVLLQFNNRSLDISNYRNVMKTVSEKDTKKDEDSVDDPMWGMRETKKRKKENKPESRSVKMRNFGEDPPRRAEVVFEYGAQSPIPSKYETWFSKHVTIDILAFFDAEIKCGDVVKYKAEFSISDLKAMGEDDLKRIFTNFRGNFNKCYSDFERRLQVHYYC